MNEQHVRRLMQDMVDAAFQPGSIDLWSRLKTQLPATPALERQRGTAGGNAPKSRRRSVGWAALGASLVAMAAFVLMTPQGRVLAQEVLSFFTRNTTNRQQVPVIQATLQPPPTGVATIIETEAPSAEEEGCGTPLSPRCSLEEVAAQVTFPLLAPDALPEGTTFSAATLLPEGALLRYEGTAGMLLLAQTAANAQELTTWTIARDTTVESVMIGEQPGEFVQGWWGGWDASLEGMPWDADLPTRALRWQSDDMRYTLVNFPAQSPDGPLGLDKAQLVMIAESMSAPNADPVDGGEARRTLAEVEQQAGFAFVEPAWLPAGVTSYDIRYDSQHNAICQYYRASADDVATTLVIAQSGWALPAPEDLLRKFYYGDQEIAMPVQQSWLPIAGADNENAAFIESGLAVEAYCGGEQTSAHRALMWMNGDRAYIIFASLDAGDGRGFVTVREMQRLAGVLNGIDPQADGDAAPDPERLRSLEQAEAVAGEDVRFPTVMLSNVRFDHIATWMVGDVPDRIATYFNGQPVGDGRTYGVDIFQTPNSEQTLEDLEQWGGYRQVSVHGNPAIYQESCWDSTTLAGGIECHQILTWFEDGAQFDVITYFPALVPQEVILAIAESLE